MAQTGRLAERVALITGAGVGFGEAISLGFAEFGCDIAACDLHIENPQRTAERARKFGGRAIALQANVAIPEDITAMVDATVSQLGGIDILINCAGIPQHDPAESTPLETWDRVLDINLRGTFLCCQAAARVMLKKGSGVIVNFSSIAGVVGVGRGANAYCASKGGVNAMTKQLARRSPAADQCRGLCGIGTAVSRPDPVQALGGDGAARVA